MHLSKLHATGNDFLVHVDLDASEDALDGRIAAALCDRFRGVGADGVIRIGAGHDGADCSMTLWNADGGRAEMSGNGIRCLAWVAARAGLGDEESLTVDTAAGRRLVHVERGRAGITAADVDMGPVTFEPGCIPFTGDDPFDVEVVADHLHYRGDAAGIGNPHLVLFVDDVAAVPVGTCGPVFEHDERFPQRTNVEFVRIVHADRLAIRVWERGVGETQSCGTGACAAAAVAHRRGLVGEGVQVDVLGGELVVTLGPTVRLGGPVRHVFDVDVALDRLRDAP